MCCTQYAIKFGNLRSGHRTGKGLCFIPIPKKGNAKECSNYCTIALISHISKVMPKILQARLQHMWTIFKLYLEKARDQIANICWIIEKARDFQKSIYFCFIDYAKALTVWITTNCRKFLKMETPDHLTCLLRILYAGQEATVRTGYGTTDWFQIGKGVCQGCILSPCLVNVYAEYIMWNAGWMKHKLESRLPGNLSITSDMQMTPPLYKAEGEELKSLLMKVKKESEKGGLTSTFKKPKS